jgi:hypothetical protein
MMKRVLAFAIPIAFLALASLHPARAADQIATWNSTNNPWSAAAHWSTGLFPHNGNAGFTYDAILGGGAITLDRNIAIQRYTQSGGSLLASSPFTLTVHELFTWSGGTLTNAGVVQANGGMALNGTTKSLNGGHTINNAGNATWSAGDFTTGGGAIFNNQIGGIFTTTFDGNFNFNQGGAPTQFNNAGTFDKTTGVGTTAFTTIFNNSGAVNASSGTLSLSAGGTHAGAFAVGVAGTLHFSGGTHHLNAGTAVSGTGSVQVGNGTVNFNAGTFDVGGTTTINGGTVNFNAPASTNLLTVSSGARGGTDTLMAGLFTWSGGTLTNAGVTQANGGMTLNGVTKSLNGGHTLNNAGNATWTAGDFTTGGGAIFNNQIGGTFATTFDGNFNFNQGGAPTQFNNAGTFSKSGSLGTTSFTTIFNNSGTVNAGSGTLSFHNGLTQTSGTLSLNGGSIRANAPLNILSGSVTGSGTIMGSVANDGTIAPGFTAGRIDITGDLTLGGNSLLAIEIGGTAQSTQYDLLTEAGSATLTLGGLLKLSFFDDAQDVIRSADTFTILTSTQTLGGTFANVANGMRLETDDGFGSFQVNYGAGSAFAPNSVVLSNFANVSIPEPGSMALLAAGAMLLLRRSRSAARIAALTSA